MPDPKTFAELFEALRGAGMYPGLITEGTGKVPKEVVTGLWVYCSPMLQGDKVARVREIAGDGFVVDFLPNKLQIEITKKEDAKKVGVHP